MINNYLDEGLAVVHQLARNSLFPHICSHCQIGQHSHYFTIAAAIIYTHSVLVHTIAHNVSCCCHVRTSARFTTIVIPTELCITVVLRQCDFR